MFYNYQETFWIVGNLHINFTMVVYSPTNITSLFYPVSKFSLVHGQVTIIFVVSVCLSVCLFVCAEFFSAVFYPVSIKLGHMVYVWV